MAMSRGVTVCVRPVQFHGRFQHVPGEAAEQELAQAPREIPRPLQLCCNMGRMLREDREQTACPAPGCARSITIDEALRILEAMDRAYRHPEPPLGAATVAEAPSTGGYCHAARAGAKASPVCAKIGGAAARTGPARCGPGDAVLVELRSQQSPRAERLARRRSGKMQSATVARHRAWGPGDDLLVQLKMLQPRLRVLRARRLNYVRS